MGRKKIAIKKINDLRRRQVTFGRRKFGLMKKAYELSVLCGCDVGLFIITKNDKLHTYSNKRMENILMEYKELSENPEDCEILDDDQVVRMIECSKEGLDDYFGVNNSEEDNEDYTPKKRKKLRDDEQFQQPSVPNHEHAYPFVPVYHYGEKSANNSTYFQHPYAPAQNTLPPLGKGQGSFNLGYSSGVLPLPVPAPTQNGYMLPGMQMVFMGQPGGMVGLPSSNSMQSLPMFHFPPLSNEHDDEKTYHHESIEHKDFAEKEEAEKSNCKQE